MSFFYPFKVNKALAGLGIPPTIFDGRWRVEMQQMGIAEKLTPEETAIVIIGYGLRTNYADSTEIVMAYHIENGEIDPEKPIVKEALHQMGFFYRAF